MTTHTALRIDFVSDIACPWCAIGLASLQKALAQLDDTVHVDIHFQPFELNPDMDFEGEDTGERLMRKYGFDAEQLEANRRTLRERAADVGITLDLGPGSRSWNTFDAHRLLHWAQEQGQSAALALKQALFQAYFAEHRNVADHVVLLSIIDALGLDHDAAREVLDSQRYAQAVRTQEQHYQNAGIRSVPATIINNTWVINGGQPPATFLQALREISQRTTQPTPPDQN